MTKAADDSDAVRAVVEQLESFDNDSRERIIRWAREKLGMERPVQSAPSSRGTESSAETTPSTIPATSPTTDIKSFVSQKSPKGDTQFAATVAYYHQFVAPQRKASITKDDIVDACRKVVRRQPASPAQVLVNAYNDGLFDRAGTGEYALNSVGENLVAMALPEGESSARRTTRKKPARQARKGSAGRGKGTRKKP